jgi:hypothetical protein
MRGDGERKTAAQFQDFLAKADYCERKAQAMHDPILRETYEELARHWHAMASLALRRRQYA